MIQKIYKFYKLFGQDNLQIAFIFSYGKNLSLFISDPYFKLFLWLVKISGLFRIILNLFV